MVTSESFTSRTFISELVPEKQNPKSFHGSLRFRVSKRICWGCGRCGRGPNRSTSWQPVGEVALRVEVGGLI